MTWESISLCYHIALDVIQNKAYIKQMLPNNRRLDLIISQNSSCQKNPLQLTDPIDMI